MVLDRVDLDLPAVDAQPPAGHRLGHEGLGARLLTPQRGETHQLLGECQLALETRVHRRQDAVCRVLVQPCRPLPAHQRPLKRHAGELDV